MECKQERVYLREIKRLFTALVILPAVIFAGDVSSMSILQNLFGSVNNLLGGSDGLTALQFKIFNVSIMIFAMLFVGVTITQGVVQTATQGILMGRKHGQSAYYTFFRSSSGLFLVFPMYNGYSIIQYMVMSIVLQSTSLATDLASTIINQSMLYNSEDTIRSVVTGSESKAQDNALNNSRLANITVQNFYNTVAYYAEASVMYNRQLPSGQEKNSGSALYSIEERPEEYRVIFDGLDPTINYISLTKSNNSSFLNESLKLLINPVINKLFRCLPVAAPAGAGPRSCIANDSRGSCGPGEGHTRDELLKEIKGNIEANHDAMFASTFVLKIVPGVTSGNDAKINFIPNWLQFPFLYQSAQEIKLAGLSATSTQDLVEKAYPFANGVFGTSSQQPTVKYTSLGTGELALIKHLPLPGAPLGSFAAVTSSGNAGIDYSERAEAKNKVKQQLARLVQASYSNTPLDGASVDFDSLSGESTLTSLWGNQNYWSDIQSKTYSSSTSSFDAEREAMIPPIRSFVYHTGSKWIETFIEDSNTAYPKIAIAPLTSLMTVSSQFAHDSILVTFTIMRNVVAEQIINAFDSFWEFFAIKLGLSVGTAGTNLLQQFMWDKVGCNMINVQPGVGSSAMIPMCEPIMIAILPNVTYPVSLGVTIGLAVGSTVANVGMTIGDEVSTGLFMLDWFVKTQFAYQYYGYILMSLLPVMIVSNLLAIWVPMLPPIVFFLAVIGWTVAVIEAMIASPLILLGMTFPQGHDFLGSSQQALILLLSVFVRAPLIIMGYFAGMLILQISMVMLSVAVAPMILSLFDTSEVTVESAFMMYAFMVITMYLSASLLSQTLALTYKLPNTIVQWIGGSPAEGIEAQAVQQIQSVVNQQQQGMLDSIKQAGMSAKNDQMAGQATGGVGAAGNVKQAAN